MIVLLRLSPVLVMAALAACGSSAGTARGSSATPTRAPLSSATPTGPTGPAGTTGGDPGVPSIVRDPAASTACGKLATTLASDAPLLADRLRIRVPAGVNLAPRAYNIMSSPTPPEEESRVMLGGGASAGTAPGDSAFVILAQETWQLDTDRARAEADAPVQPGPLDEEARKFLHATTGDDSLDVARVRVADAAVRIYAGRPSVVKARDGADAALVLALLVALPDATLQRISFYVSPELAGQPGCTRFADRIADTLAIGPRKLERAGGVRSLHPVSPTQALAITLPEDYVAVHQPGPDFDTYKLLRLRPLSLYPGSITVSVDAHPDRDVPPGTVPEKGTLLGRPVTWHAQRSPRGGVMVATQPLAAGKSSDRRFVQVTIIATRQAKFLDEFRRVAESLALVPRSAGSSSP